jgi:hypothetical protein
MKKILFLLTMSIALCAIFVTGCTIDPIKSSDATLKSIAVSAGSLSPAFEREKTSYTLALPKDVASVTVTGTANDSAATVVNPAVVENLSQGGSKAIEILVTAEDGTKKTYAIAVSREAAVVPGTLSAAKSITAFTVAESESCAINETDGTIALVMPYGTDVMHIAPTITFTGASVSPASGVVTDFSSSVSYVVTAADSSKKTYVVTVTCAGPAAKSITAFTVAESESCAINEAAGTIALVMPYGTDVMHIAPTITFTGASVSPASGVVTNFSSPVSYVVTATDSSTKSYLVTVTCAEPEGLGYTIDRVFSAASGRLFFTSGKVLAEIVNEAPVVIHEFDAAITCATGEGSNGILLSVGSAVIRYDLVAATESVFYTATAAVTQFILMGDFAIVDTSSKRLCVRLSTGVASSSSDLSYPSNIITTASSRSRVLWLTTNVIPVDIKYQDVNTVTGALASTGDSAYHGGIDSYPVLVSTPDGSRVIQGDGSVFSTDDAVERIAKLPYRFIDAEFYDDSLFLLTEDSQVVRLGAEAPYAFEANVGTTEESDPRALMLCGTTLYAFSDDAAGITHMDSWTGGDLGASVADPVTAFNANGSILWSPARNVVSDSDGTLYYAGSTVLGSLNGSDQAILRYFDQSITGLALESAGVLLVSEGPRLWRYTASSDALVQIYQTSADTIRSFIPVGNYAVVFTSSMAYSVSLTTGVVASSKSVSYMYGNPVWSATAGVIYAATELSTPKDLHAFQFNSSTGAIGTSIDSQYHGTYPFTGPYHLSSDDSLIFCGDGNYFSGTTPLTSKMPWVATLGTSYANKDMFITGGKLYLFTNLGQLLRLSATSPYAFEALITSVTSDPRALAFGGGYAWVLSANATDAWVTYALRIAGSSL